MSGHSRSSDVLFAYLVCASQRSGTEFLCTSLEDTGVAGRPPGALFDIGVATYSTVESFRSAVRRTVGETTGPNGVCCQRMFWNGLQPFLDNARRDRVTHAKPDHDVIADLLCSTVHYVWLKREDKLRQAISFWRATAGPSGREQWRKPTHPEEAVSTPAFDRDAVAKFVKLLSEQDDLWQGWFDNNSIKPLVVTYDELLAERHATIRRVLGALGLNPDAADGLRPARVQRQADEHTDRYVALYEAGNPATSRA